MTTAERIDHDEYELRVHESDVERTKVMLSETITRAQEKYKLKVELKTDSRVGSSWRDCH